MDQLELFPEDPKKEKPVDKDKVDKAKARTAENEEFKDKRVKASPLTVQAELAKMREILAKPKGGGGAAMGGSGVDVEGLKMNKNVKPKLKAGGSVKSASKRADGCCIRGKTRA
jgi:hypothetical protein